LLVDVFFPFLRGSHSNTRSPPHPPRPSFQGFLVPGCRVVSTWPPFFESRMDNFRPVSMPVFPPPFWTDFRCRWFYSFHITSWRFDFPKLCFLPSPMLPIPPFLRPSRQSLVDPGLLSDLLAPPRSGMFAARCTSRNFFLLSITTLHSLFCRLGFSFFDGWSPRQIRGCSLTACEYLGDGFTYFFTYALGLPPAPG